MTTGQTTMTMGELLTVTNVVPGTAAANILAGKQVKIPTYVVPGSTELISYSPSSNSAF